MHGASASAFQLALPAWLASEDFSATTCAGAEARVAFAIDLARRNIAHGGGPFGAVVFDAEGRVVATGVNQVVAQCCSLAHAELLALALAQKTLGRFRLNADGGRYILATSAQPCCQCFGALVWSGIDELLIGARGEDVEALTEFDEGPLPADWGAQLQQRGITVRRDLQREAARGVLADYVRLGGTRY